MTELLKTKDITLYQSYKLCRNIFFNYSKSYYIGSCVFDYPIFKHITSLYAFIRVVNEITDLNSLTKIKNDLKFLLKISASLKEFSDNKNHLIKMLTEDWYIWANKNLVFKAVISTLITLDIDHSLFNTFFNSIELDLTKFCYKTIDELETYIEGYGMFYGDLMLQIILNNSNYSKSFKKDFYSTNIGYAKGLGYSYHYTTLIRDFNSDNFKTPSYSYLYNDNENKTIGEFIKDNIEYNRLLYAYCNDGIYNLYSLDYKIGNSIHISKTLFSSILKQIEDNNYNVEKRISLSQYEKYKIIYKKTSFCELISILLNLLFYTYFYHILYFIY